MEKMKILIYVTVFTPVLLVFIAKGVLQMTRYGINISATQCEYINQTSSTATEGTDQVDHEYVFTVIVYGILSVLRFLEYVLLAKQFYTFLFVQDKVPRNVFFTACRDRSTCLHLTLFMLILLPYFVLGSFVIPGLGIYQEVEHSERLADCYGHYHEVYIVYSVVNVFRYVFAFSVRIVMIYCALILKNIWFPTGGPQLMRRHTSYGLMMLKRRATASKGCTNPAVSFALEPVQLTERDNALEKDLADWKMISEDWKERFRDYIKIGEKARAMQELFGTWFIIPWVVYLIHSSLKTYNVLRPWDADGDGDTPPTDIPQVYYLLYNVNQFITLLIPYLCAKKINNYHQEYLSIMRNEQLMKFEDDPARFSMARKLIVIRHPVEEYDLLPRIIGTDITISVGDPIYIITFLVGIFLSVSESLVS